MLSVIVLVAIVAGGAAWHELQRRDLFEQIARIPGVEIELGCRMSPQWLPQRLQDQVPWSLCLVRQPYLAITEEISPADFELLNRWREFQYVELRRSEALSDDMLLKLIERQSLLALRFMPPRRLNSEHLSALVKKPELIELETLAGPFSQDDINAFGEMSRLENLTLDGSVAPECSLQPLAKLTCLLNLEWHHSGLSDKHFTPIAPLGSLKAIELLETTLTSKSWPLLETMSISYRHLESPGIDDGIVRALTTISKRNPDINSVALLGGSVSDNAIKELVTISSLTNVEVDAKRLTPACIDEFAKLKNLGSLNLRNAASIDDASLSKLALLKLWSLELDHTQITDEGVSALANHPTLIELSLSGSRITDRSIPILGAIPELNSLDLRDTAISNKGLDQLQEVLERQIASNPGGKPTSGIYIEWPHITQLKLSRTKVTSDRVREFRQTFQLMKVERFEEADPASANSKPSSLPE